MKKIIFIVLPIIVYILIGTVFKEKNIIPAEAIRIRILANSNKESDQNLKMEVKNKLEPFLYNLLKNENNAQSAKNKIIVNMDNIKKEIDLVINNRVDYTINFGKNYFPNKEYKGINYEEGYYDSLLITLGDGLGDNWWCVLFPPLCLLEGKEYSDVEYTTYVGELINKYLK